MSSLESVSQRKQDTTVTVDTRGLVIAIFSASDELHHPSVLGRRVHHGLAVLQGNVHGVFKVSRAVSPTTLFTVPAINSGINMVDHHGSPLAQLHGGQEEQPANLQPVILHSVCLLVIQVAASHVGHERHDWNLGVFV